MTMSMSIFRRKNYPDDRMIISIYIETRFSANVVKRASKVVNALDVFRLCFIKLRFFREEAERLSIILNTTMIPIFYCQ